MTSEIESRIYEAHLLNYRIAFDAMITLQSFQNEQKKDMISILNGIFISIITVYAGIFYFIVSPDYKIYNPVAILIILILASLYTFLIVGIKKRNIEKIISDNFNFELFKNECQFEREYLRLDDHYKKEKRIDSIYWNLTETAPTNQNNSNYMAIINFITTYCNSVILIVVSLALISIIIILKQVIS